MTEQGAQRLVLVSGTPKGVGRDSGLALGSFLYLDFRLWQLHCGQVCCLVDVPMDLLLELVDNWALQVQGSTFAKFLGWRVEADEILRELPCSGLDN